MALAIERHNSLPLARVQQIGVTEPTQPRALGLLSLLDQVISAVRIARAIEVASPERQRRLAQAWLLDSASIN